ncbi:MAG: hypothetical protein JSR55_13180 [Proteobacteria bacterium]|nr:hypothetical protein [Pseudomonadota bacterium]
MQRAAPVPILAAIVLAAEWAAGPPGLLFLALEMFNYIAHYGLIRERDAGGRLEPFAPHHGWNSGNVLANAAIFNKGGWRCIVDPKVQILRA